MNVKDIVEMVLSLSTGHGVSVESVIKELQASIVTFQSLEFTVRTQNVLAMNEIDSIDKLCAYTEKELKELPLSTKKLVLEVKSVLESRGLTLNTINESE